MTSHRCQHNLTFNTIKNGDKEYICHCLLFLLKKKVLLTHTELFVKRMVKILWSLERVRISLNDLKMVISILVIKIASDSLQLCKRRN